MTEHTTPSASVDTESLYSIVSRLQTQPTNRLMTIIEDLNSFSLFPGFDFLPNTAEKKKIVMWFCMILYLLNKINDLSY